MDGVPVSNPGLGRDGRNLPAVIDKLKNENHSTFGVIVDVLRNVLPQLDAIDVVMTQKRTMGLIFQESGFDQPWTIGDVSDGTVMTLGLLAALFDESSKATVLEEPENSLHPWAIGQFVEACRLAAQTKQVMLTTHSPVLINNLRPEEIWVVSKPGTDTVVDQLVALDPDAKVGWEKGRFTLSDYLDSGIVPAAVPAPPA